jgi:hypothetical protein
VEWKAISAVLCGIGRDCPQVDRGYSAAEKVIAGEFERFQGLKPKVLILFGTTELVP